MNRIRLVMTVGLDAVGHPRIQGSVDIVVPDDKEPGGRDRQRKAACEGAAKYCAMRWPGRRFRFLLPSG